MQEIFLLLSQHPAELFNAPQYAKVLDPVKKEKVFGQAFFKRLVRVKGRKPIVALRRGRKPLQRALRKR